jgi:hypothetical protein
MFTMLQRHRSGDTAGVAAGEAVGGVGGDDHVVVAARVGRPADDGGTVAVRPAVEAAAAPAPIPTAAAAAPSLVACVKCRRVTPGTGRPEDRTSMIAKDLIIAKDLCTYRRIFLHQEKILRDHAMSDRPLRTHAIPQKW